MSNSRWIIGTALAALFLAVVAFGADFLLTNAIRDSQALAAGRIARLRYVQDPNEIPIFGSSKAEADYVPSVLGKGFYNYGLASTGLNVTNWLLETELRRPSRQPIIIDLVQWTVVEFGDVRNYLPVSQDKDVRDFLKGAGLWRWYYAVPGLRYFNSWDWYVKGLITDRIVLTKRYDRGFNVNLDEAPWSRADFQEKVAARLALNYGLGIDPLEKRRLLGLVRSAPNRQFVVVLAPLHKSFFAHNDGGIGLRKSLSEMRRGLPNLHVIDMTHANFPDQYFLDTAHLNQRGSRVFSMQLRDELRRLKIVENPPEF